MEDSQSSLAVNWLNGDPLVICLHHPLNSEWTLRTGVYLGEAPVMLKDELAGLEVEQERGRLLIVLMTTGQHAHALL